MNGRIKAGRTGFMLLLVIAMILSACATDPTRVPTAADVPQQPAQAQEATETLMPTQSTANDAESTATPQATQATYLPVVNNVTKFPDASQYDWVKIVDGLKNPLDIEAPEDDSGRLFIVEQAGVIKVLNMGADAPVVFMDITDRVGSDANERGLLGLAFHPQFAENGYFYLDYTDKNGNTVLARYSVANDDPNRGDSTSEHILLQQAQPFANHNGGGLGFGPDGYLYVSLGDGGSGGDPQGNGQSTDTLLGKLLRVDVNGGTSDAPALQIPADNPFASGGGRAEIWSYGLRNAWRFTFDRGTGDLYIADVGQNAWEEVNFQKAGAAGGQNYGWNLREGMHEYQGTPPADANLIDPVWEYGHDQGCSITGGVVVRAPSLPEWNGIYLAADFCNGWTWGLLQNQEGSWKAQKMFETGYNITAFGQDSAGEVYLTDFKTGALYQLRSAP